MIKAIIAFSTLTLALATAAHAEVKNQGDTGFVIGHSGEVLAKPDDVWKRLVAPKTWWNPTHSWFGKAEGMYIDAQAGGCFCETAQDKTEDGQTRVRGSVEHMRVIFADPGKVLRMQGALGPLQSEAVIGTLTIAMEPLKDGAGTRLSFSYVVGAGYMRYKISEIAPAVDKVLGEQFARLIQPLGKVVMPEGKAAPAKDGEWSLDPATLEEQPADKTKPPADAAKPATPKPAGDAAKSSVEPKAADEKPKAAAAPPETKPVADKPKASTDAKAPADKPKPQPATAEKDDE